MGERCSIARESNAYCPYGCRLLSNEEKDHKDHRKSEVKMSNPSAKNSKSGEKSQSGQASNWSKKDFRSNKGGQWGQSNNTPATGVNATVVKKNKKQGEQDISQVEYSTYHKKGHYTNKCPDKKPKN